jgi:hypothetical protein
MPSQEFFAILEMIIHPDVIEPELLRGGPEQGPESTQASSCATARPFVNISLN